MDSNQYVASPISAGVFPSSFAQKGRPKKSRFDKHEEKIRTLAALGQTPKQIAETLEANYWHLYYYLKVKGIKAGAGHTKNPETIDKHGKIIRFYLEKHTLQQTGDKFGLTRERVRQILNENGIQPRRSTPKIQPFKPKKILSPIQKFWSLVDKAAGDEACWLWTAGKDRAGYGRFRYNGASHYAHRLAFYFANGRRAKKCVLHSCDNPQCVNPKHLREGTAKDNAEDREKRGRGRFSKLRAKNFSCEN